MEDLSQNELHEFWSIMDLSRLPYIGPVTCYHLARNIGLSSCVKPDLHLKRLVNSLFGNDDEKFVQQIIQKLADQLQKTPGEVDFSLWVWLSHEGCQKEGCCGILRLR
ncbi:Conserved_hypothetical protein [Hexamita inflata]|uniref:Uncharacterized protein n=1 Tax=Hexamita inflata TaxID=28002 RepID=A0AA86RSJ3_9EUKA|nr:Conserved hypothetical protein [Hexamita inflata]